VAFDRQEAWAGLICVAVPIFGTGGRPVAALSISGQAGRFDPASHAAALRRVGMAATRAVRHAGVGTGRTRTAGLLPSGTR
jgi:DNA-binding IclR family transcriptional regulator